MWFGLIASRDFHKYAHSENSTESRTALSMWLCDQHNRVNEKLGKPTFRCEMVKKRRGRSKCEGVLPQINILK